MSRQASLFSLGFIPDNCAEGPPPAQKRQFNSEDSEPAASPPKSIYQHVQFAESQPSPIVSASGITTPDPTVPMAKTMVEPSGSAVTVLGAPTTELSETLCADLGRYMPTQVRRLSDEKKLWLLKHALRPAADFKYPSKVEYSKSRSFQHAWLKEYPWLVYSPACDGGFCLSCILFSRNILSLGQLVNSPMVNFTRAKQTLQEHSTQRFHQLSVEDTAVFTGQMERGYVSIGQQVQSQSARAIEKNRKVLLSMLKAIIFCGRQNIALRGRCSDGSDGNPGNFEALLQFRVDSGDTILTEHLSMAAKNAQYRSPTIQNEFISAVGEYIQQHILTEVREATCFSLCADEAVDAGNKEQLPLVLRFVDNENQIREEFIQFVLCDTGTTGEAIALNILGSLEKLALYPNKLRGQGYDGAGNMAGKYRGAAAVIQVKYPRAMYIHCTALL